MIFPGFPGVLSFFQVFQVEWESCHLYRPQHSCGKVMFLHLSLSHSIHGGCLADTHQADTPRQIQPWVDTPWPDTPLARHSLGQTHPLARSPGRHPPGQTPPVQTHPPGRHPLGRHPPHPAATAADGTHPTGMLSCW